MTREQLVARERSRTYLTVGCAFIAGAAVCAAATVVMLPTVRSPAVWPLAWPLFILSTFAGFATATVSLLASALMAFIEARAVARELRTALQQQEPKE